MFKFIAALFGTNATTPAQADALLAADTEYWDTVVPDRFVRVVETQSHFIAYDAPNHVAARIKKPDPCIGVTHDWDAGIDIDCPDHRGVYCPGGRSPLK